MDKMTLLCVDDDENILRSLQRSLRTEDYRVLIANTVEQALTLLASESIQIVMVDHRMPNMNGSDLLSQIKVKHPDILRLILSGFADVASIIDAINEGEIYRFLAKPWNDNELKVTLKQCFETYTLRNDNKKLIRQVSSKNKELVELNNHLEKTLLARTKLLKLIQEVIDHIPIPLVGIDMDGLIVTINNKATNNNNASLILGTNINELLAEDTVHRIKSLIQSDVDSKRLVNSDLGEIEIIPFNIENETRGAIIVMEGMPA